VVSPAPKAAGRVAGALLRRAAAGRLSVAAGLAGLGAAALLSGCGGSGVTPPALQASMARSFANLYVLYQVEEGNPRPNPADLRPQASCQKGTQSTPQVGPGNNWVCYVTYLVDGPGTPVTATYNVDVKPDGCYAADGDGPASLNGSLTITGPGDRQFNNPLRLIDGCFDAV
jgi:ABC-2 type transport system permease protein